MEYAVPVKAPSQAIKHLVPGKGEVTPSTYKNKTLVNTIQKHEHKQSAYM